MKKMKRGGLIGGMMGTHRGGLPQKLKNKVDRIIHRGNKN